MALSSRQVALYGHSVIIWREAETFAGDGKPGALSWAPVDGTTVTTGAASATQTVASTSGWAAGDTLFFVTAQASRVIASITSGTVVVLTATVTTTTAEKVALVLPCYADVGKSQMAPNGGVLVTESDNLFTLDEFHLEYTVDVQTNDVLRMIAGPEPGNFWTCRGDRQIKSRRANMLKILCSRTPTAPNGVS